MDQLRPSRSPAFALHLKSSREEAGLSQVAAREAVEAFGFPPLPAATLSTWENGVLPAPSDEEVRMRIRALELIYGLAAGDLILALQDDWGRQRQASLGGDRRGNSNDRRALSRRRDTLLLQFKPEYDLALVEIAKSYRYFYDEAGAIRVRTEMAYVVRALEDGADRYLFTSADPWTTNLSVEGLAHCELGRVKTEESTCAVDHNKVSVHELLFDRQLHRGEFHQFSFAAEEIATEGSAPEARVRHVIQLPAERVILDLGFGSDGMVTHLTERRWEWDTLVEDPHGFRVVTPAESYRLALKSPHLQAVGWEWSWSAVKLSDQSTR